VSGPTCSWCGEPLRADEGFRAAEPAAARVARFCRLEHVVPWAIAGAHWEAGETALPDDPDLESCARCGEPAGDVPVLLVHSRGEHRIADAFCGVEHLREWAAAGGRWSSPR
jgi:hypothetical protein